MRLAIVALAWVALGCGGSRSPSHSAPPAVVLAYPATRWIPAEPSYVFASPTMRQAQHSFRDMIESLGMFAGVEVGEVSRELQQLLTIDPLNPEAVAAIGVDLEGSIAVFSEDLSPTFVVHLSAPEATGAFFDGLRERGLVTQSVIVEGTEVFTAQLVNKPGKISWAVQADWLWVHLTFTGLTREDTTWFANSHRPEGTGWGRDWQWAQQAAGAAKPAVMGFIDAKEVVASFVSKVPDAIECAKLVEPIQRVALSLDGNDKQISGRVSFDVGPAAASLTKPLLPVPAGFAGVAAQAPLSVQWNLDLVTVRTWLAPCLRTLDEDMAFIDRYGVRAGRAVLQSFDPDENNGSGAVSLELVNKRYLASQLDEIPMRSTLERSRKFGPHAGHSISVPFVATIEYVLTDAIALAAVGEGLLATVVGSGATAAGPIAAIDVAPPGLPADAWITLFGMAGMRHSERTVERLMRWRDGHLAITVEGTSLVVAASGTRR